MVGIRSVTWTSTARLETLAPEFGSDGSCQAHLLHSEQPQAQCTVPGDRSCNMIRRAESLVRLQQVGPLLLRNRLCRHTSIELGGSRVELPSGGFRYGEELALRGGKARSSQSP